MNEQELRAVATCGLCRKKVLHTGLPLFWRVRIERHGIKMDAVRRQAGMEQLMNGSVALAMVMGPNEDMTMPVMEPLEFTVCEDCAMRSSLCLAAMAEIATPAEKEEL